MLLQQGVHNEMQNANMFSFKVSADSMRKALKSLSGVIPKMPMPSIIGNILFALQPDGLLRLQATDIQSHIAIQLATSDASGEGAICIPAEKIRSICEAVKTGDLLINVNLDGFNMMVSAGRKDAAIKGFDALLFPSLDQADRSKSKAAATIPVDLLKEMIKKVGIAAAVDDNRPYLMGIQVTFENDRMTMIATDSFRAAIAECEALGQPSLSTILPANSFRNAAETLSELANIDNVSIIMLDNSVQLVADNVGVQLTPLSGIYPKVKGAFSAPQKTTMIVSTGAILNAIKFVTSFEGNLVITTENVGGGKALLKMYCTDGQIGEGTDAVDVAIKGNPIKVTMNPTYLEAHIALYNALKIPELQLQFNGNNTPMVIKPCFGGDIDESFATIVMPINEDKGKK